MQQIKNSAKQVDKKSRESEGQQQQQQKIIEKLLLSRNNDSYSNTPWICIALPFWVILTCFHVAQASLKFSI